VCQSPAIELPDDDTSPELAAEYDAARERAGRVMAILRALGPRAEVVQAFVALTDAVIYGPAALGRRERELLAVATSNANGAIYSSDMHGALLEKLGGPDGSARDHALMAFARRVTLTPHESAAAADELAAYLGAEELSDAVNTVALLNLANRVALAAGISPADDA
jgi:AhpD family alkylhydroperoxidase